MTTTTASGATADAMAEELVTRAAVFALLARLLGRDTGALAEGSAVRELDRCLGELGAEVEREWLAALDALPRYDREVLDRLWIRWFDQGRVPPYECSNTTINAGGHTAPLADIAGFYRAFGVKVHGDRPDHVVAELEYASLVTLAEARARLEGRAEDAAVSAGAARTFLRDHLGRWLDAWAPRVLAIDPPVPWGPIAAAAAVFVASEARRRNVIIVQSDRMFADVGDLPEVDDVLECGEGTSGSLEP